MGLDPVTGTLLALAAIGTGASVRAQRDAAGEQRKARKVEQRMQQAKAARERRAQVRQAIQAQAEAQQAAQVSGAESSAGVQAQGSITTQLASNLSFLNEQQQGAQQISIFQQAAADDQSRAGAFQASAGLALQGASLFSPTGK